MKKLLIVLMALFLFGCISSPSDSPPLDLQMGNSASPADEAESELFSYMEYNGVSIPVLPDRLPIEGLFYLKSQSSDPGAVYELVPRHLIAKSGCLLSRYRDDGDPERHGTLIDYITIEKTDSDLTAEHEGYVLNDGALYLSKTDLYHENIDALESYSYIYTNREKDAGINIEWTYTPENPDEQNKGQYWANIIYDLKTKQIISNDTYITQNMDLFSRKPETPEFRNGEKKDVQEIRRDLGSMPEIGEIRELAYNDGRLNKGPAKFSYAVGNFIVDGIHEEPITVCLDPLSAKLADFNYEKTDEPDGDWVLTNEKNRYVFDDGWKLLSWSDDDYSVEYSYSDSSIELKITDLKSGSVEEIGYDQ